VMQQAGMCGSTSEARRLIQQGALRVNGEKFNASDGKIKPEPGMIIKAGKRKFIRLA